MWRYVEINFTLSYVLNYSNPFHSGKPTKTRYGDGSVQTRQVKKRLHKQPLPYIFFLLHVDVPSNLKAKLTQRFQVLKKDVGTGLLV